MSTFPRNCLRPLVTNRFLDWPRRRRRRTSGWFRFDFRWRRSLVITWWLKNTETVAWDRNDSSTVVSWYKSRKNELRWQYCLPLSKLQSFNLFFIIIIIIIHTIQVLRWRKKYENIRNCRKRIDRNYTTICTIFESVCKSQSSKAFELAATNLQVKKGLGKERNNN